jgi:hypothetical protein
LHHPEYNPPCFFLFGSTYKNTVDIERCSSLQSNSDLQVRCGFESVTGATFRPRQQRCINLRFANELASM